MYQGEMVSPKMMVSNARKQVEAYNAAMAVRKENKGSSVMAGVKWSKPPENVVKRNWDAFLDERRKTVELGVARDFEGRVLAVMCD